MVSIHTTNVFILQEMKRKLTYKIRHKMQKSHCHNITQRSKNTILKKNHFPESNGHDNYCDYLVLQLYLPEVGKINCPLRIKILTAI